MTHPLGPVGHGSTEHSQEKCAGTWGRDLACQDFHYCDMDRAVFCLVLCVKRIVRLWELLEKDLFVIDSLEANKVFRAGRCSFPKRPPNWWSVWNIFLYTAYFISNTRLNYKRQGLGGIRPLSFIMAKTDSSVLASLGLQQSFHWGTFLLSFPFCCGTVEQMVQQSVSLSSWILCRKSAWGQSQPREYKRKRNWRHYLTFGFWPYLKPMAFFILLNEASLIWISITCDQK